MTIPPSKRNAAAHSETVTGQKLLDVGQFLIHDSLENLLCRIIATSFVKLCQEIII
jgi:hypothetical protein